jgi:hypothetical protein
MHIGHDLSGPGVVGVKGDGSKATCTSESIILSFCLLSHLCALFSYAFFLCYASSVIFFTARSNRSSALKLEPEVKLCNQNYVSLSIFAW